MAKLEYRLLDETNNFPVLFYYADIDKAEIAARFACDNFIRDGVVYEKTSCAVELITYVIYLQKSSETNSAIEGAVAASGKVRVIIEDSEIKASEVRYKGKALDKVMVYQDYLTFFITPVNDKATEASVDLSVSDIYGNAAKETVTFALEKGVEPFFSAEADYTASLEAEYSLTMGETANTTDRSWRGSRRRKRTYGP